MMSATVPGKPMKMPAMVLGKPMKMMMAIITMMTITAMTVERAQETRLLVTMLRQQTWHDHLVLELHRVFKTGRRASKGLSPVTSHNCRVGTHPAADVVCSACWLRSLIRALQYKEIVDLRVVVCRNPQVAPA
jgi:hypothetical protein